MRGHRLILPMLLWVAGAGSLFAQGPDPASLVRLSFVEGQVSILQGDVAQFQQAQANMPLLAGYTLATGDSGQAEVEFMDGSVARLTPQSQLRLDRLPRDARNGATDLTMLSGLGYFELNTADGQRYTVHYNAAEARPIDNSIFRINLDDAPEVAVLAGRVRASASGAFDQTVEQGYSLRFQPDDVSSVSEPTAIRSDTWDRWNQDRDDQIARESQQQTSARETSGATNQPGWDDLDYYGDWYPMEGYGNVWVPNDVPSGWDPYGSGYWADYPGWGATWISAYPWGWLPYHCGAWNYWNSFGWGWVPGQCGLGWQPVVTVWNAPYGYRPPPRPIPGGHAGPAMPARQLTAVNRGPALASNGTIHNNHTLPIRVDGQRLDPLPVLQNPTLGRSGLRGGVGTPVPVGRSYGFAGNNGNHVMGPGVSPGVGVRPAPGGGGQLPPRPIYSAPVGRAPAPIGPIYRTPNGGSSGSTGPVTQGPRTPSVQPRMSAPPSMPQPRMSAPPPSSVQPRMAPPQPHFAAPAPSPRMSAPAPAPHFSAPSAPSVHR